VTATNDADTLHQRFLRLATTSFCKLEQVKATIKGTASERRCLENAVRLNIDLGNIDKATKPSYTVPCSFEQWAGQGVEHYVNTLPIRCCLNGRSEAGVSARENVVWIDAVDFDKKNFLDLGATCRIYFRTNGLCQAYSRLPGSS
jgi:hypothetical protein